MLGIDTNILIRFFVQDDENQLNSVVELFLAQEEKKDKIFISNVVLVEFVWVLKKTYRIPKSDILSSLNKIISNSIFCFEDKIIFSNAIDKYSNNGGDFADYLIGNIGYRFNTTTTFTFDKKLNRDEHFTLLK